MPIITLEVISRDSDSQIYYEEQAESSARGGRLHDAAPEPEPPDADEEAGAEPGRSRGDLLEYLVRGDGSAVCRLCGEVLASRTHWYRHKYKLHAPAPALQPAPLYQCDQCLVYFKSKKGYFGHVASRHAEPGDPAPPAQPPEVVITPVRALESRETDGPPTSHTTVQSPPKIDRKTCKSAVPEGGGEERSAHRSREEKLVADIIDRVRRECEAQGAGGAARRGYTRRATVMHS